jgi:hypothetical protein
MKIGFVILTHSHPNHLVRLVAKLYSPNTRIFIHVDRGKGRNVYDTMCEQLAEYPSIIWLPRCYSHWGSWGLVHASLSGLQQAQQAQCDYAILLSGQDYPIKPLPHLLSFLEQNNGSSFLQYHHLPSDQWPSDGPSRYTRWHFNLAWKESSFRKLTNRALNRIFNTILPQRTLPDGLVPFGGGQWWCLHRACVDYVLEFTQKNPAAVNFFRYIRIPDEMYFHTVLINSHLRSTIINRSLTYLDWNGPPYPRILLTADYNDLVITNCFFARKFRRDIDEDILNMVDRSMGGVSGEIA